MQRPFKVLVKQRKNKVQYFIKLVFISLIVLILSACGYIALMYVTGAVTMSGALETTAGELLDQIAKE